MDRWAILGFVALALALPAGAAPSADIIAHNKQIVASTQGANGVFTVDEGGAVHHMQSGLICPADFPNVHLTSLVVYAVDGSDVGCDYGRYGAGGIAVSKLTLFATRAPAGMTLDEVFERYNGEVMISHPDVVPAKAANLVITDSADRPRTDYRTAAYSLPLGGKQFHSELIVGLVNGWMLEVRASYLPVEPKPEPGPDQMMDVESPYLAFRDAQRSLEAKQP